MMRSPAPATWSAITVLSYIISVLLIAACVPTETTLGDGTVLIQTQKATYAGGDTVQLSIHNIGEVDLGYMPCPLFLDRREGSSWAEHGSPLLTMCNAVITPIRSGERQHLPVHLPEGLPTGIYRIRLENIAHGERFFEVKLPLEFRVSNPFGLR